MLQHSRKPPPPPCCCHRCRRCTYTAWRRTLPSGKSEYKSITISGALCAAAVVGCSWRSGSMGCRMQCSLPPQPAKLCSAARTALQPLQAYLHIAKMQFAEDSTAEEFMDFYLDDETRCKWDSMLSGEPAGWGGSAG